MDIEFSLNISSTHSFFRPIQLFSSYYLYQQPILLQNAFALSATDTQPSVLLTLTDNHLFISDPSAFNTQPYAGVTLDFDLKFQVIYQNQKNIFSNKQGIRLFYDDQHYFSFYSHETCIFQAWILYLSKKINRKGFHEMFKPLKKLGKGNFASVYEVERVTDGAKFAVKAFSKQSCFSAKNGKESLINQLAVMRELSSQPHKNVLELEGVYQSDNSIYVVLEILTGGQLLHRIQQQHGSFSPAEIREFMFGLLSGLKQMHSHRIMHRDLKPQNIMLRCENSMQPVIVDFGLATNADLENYLFFRCGTPGYVAPEIIELTQCRHIEPQCDIFSAGVILHILLTRKALFEGTRYEEVYKKNKQMKIDLSGEKYANIDASALDLLKKMLIANPQQRITATQALEHPFFSQNIPMQTGKQKLLNSRCLTAASSRRGSLICK